MLLLLQKWMMMMDVLMAVCARCKTRQRYTDERLREERLAVRKMGHMTQRLAAKQSEYRREVTEKGWKHILKEMVEDVRFPCSDWWNEYLHCVVS